MKNGSGKYILNDKGQPIEEPDLMKWARWIEVAKRHVAGLKGIKKPSKKAKEKINQIVKRRMSLTLQPIGKRWKKADGFVVEQCPKEAPTSMRVHINNPPTWLRRMERKRGLFNTGIATLEVFLDHTGNWTDVFTGEHFKITKR